MFILPSPTFHPPFPEQLRAPASWFQTSHHCPTIVPPASRTCTAISSSTRSWKRDAEATETTEAEAEVSHWLTEGPEGPEGLGVPQDPGYMMPIWCLYEGYMMPMCHLDPIGSNGNAAEEHHLFVGHVPPCLWVAGGLTWKNAQIILSQRKAFAICDLNMTLFTHHVPDDWHCFSKKWWIVVAGLFSWIGMLECCWLGSCIVVGRVKFFLGFTCRRTNGTCSKSLRV